MSGNVKTVAWLGGLAVVVGLLVAFGPESSDPVESKAAIEARRAEIADSYAQRTRDWDREQETPDPDECADAVTRSLANEIRRSVTLEGAKWDPSTGHMLVETTVIGADNIRGLRTMGGTDEAKLQTAREAMARCRDRRDVEVLVVYSDMHLATVQESGVRYQSLTDEEKEAIATMARMLGH